VESASPCEGWGFPYRATAKAGMTMATIIATITNATANATTTDKAMRLTTRYPPQRGRDYSAPVVQLMRLSCPVGSCSRRPAKPVSIDVSPPGQESAESWLRLFCICSAAYQLSSEPGCALSRQMMNAPRGQWHCRQGRETSLACRCTSESALDQKRRPWPQALRRHSGCPRWL
jgi:hypothetical protein